MAKHQARRTATRDAGAATASGADGHRSGLPDALVSEQVQRLAVCTAVGAGLWTYGLVMDTIVRPLTVGDSPSRRRTSSIELVAIVASLADVPRTCATRRTPHDEDRRRAGLLRAERRRRRAAQHLDGLTPITIGGAAVVEHGRHPRRRDDHADDAAARCWRRRWSRRRWIRSPSGSRTCAACRCRRSSNTFVLFMPNYACAVVATLPSHVLQRLGRRLRQAQEMGSYQLVELLGRGGMGEVWRARAPPAGARARRSSWYGPSCSARAATPRRTACCAGSSGKRRRPPR